MALFANADAAPQAGAASSVASSLGRECLLERLRMRFCDFQVRARSIEERVAVTQLPLNTRIAEEALEDYSCGVAADMRRARNDLRRGRWDIDETVRGEHDMLCFCLAVWELVHEMALSSAPSASCLLHWYTTHYLEDEVAEWWQTAEQLADDPNAMNDASGVLVEALCRLALTDGRAKVLQLLRRSAEAADPHVARICDFLSQIPSQRQMEEASATQTELRQAMLEIQSAAGKVLEKTPPQHPARQLIEIYAGCPQAVFEAGDDVAQKWGRTWVEDFIFAHAWVCPDFRRTELGDLLKAIARRRTAETIDDIDRVLFAVISLDVPALLDVLNSLPDRFPAFFVTHLVDVLYFAGRVPLKVEEKASQVVPPRDFYLIAYAKELCAGPRFLQRYAIDYVRAGGSSAATNFLETVADQYCAAAGTGSELEEALDLLTDLNMRGKLGLRHCRRYAQELRRDGDIAGCLRWACHAESCCEEPRGYYVSELLDSLAEENLSNLLGALTPVDLSEALDLYPPTHLLALLRMGGEAVGGGRPAPSGRLYFFVQYSRCRALRLAGKTASAYAPMLVRMLVTGAVPPGLARTIVEDELMPALVEDTPPLGTDEALKLMRYVQTISSDPFRRVRLTVDTEELQRAMGGCLSRAILHGSPSSSLSCASGAAAFSPQAHRSLTPNLIA